MEKEGKSRGGKESPSPPSPLVIFWDVKSCPIPEGVNPPDLVKNIYAALRHHLSDYDLKAFFAYGDPSDFSAHLLRTWELDGMKLRDVGGGYRLYKQMLLDMLGLAVEHTSSLRPFIVLISAEKLHHCLLLRVHQPGYPAVLVIPSTDPAMDYFRDWVGLLLLDWLSFPRGPGEIIPKDDRRSIAAPVTDPDDEGGS